MTSSPAQKPSTDWQDSWKDMKNPREHLVEMHVEKSFIDTQMLLNAFNNLALTSQCKTHPQHGLKGLNCAESGNNELKLLAIFDVANDASHFKNNLDKMAARLPKEMGIQISSWVAIIRKDRTPR